MSTNKQNNWQPLIYALLLVIGITGGYFLQSKKGFSLTGNKKIDQVIGLIDKQYVDTVDDAAITDAAIVAMLHNLDPHSSYIPADELVGANQQLEGNFEGIGVEFNLLDDTIFIAAVLPEGPAEKAGLLAGDRIIKVENETVAGVGIDNGGVAKRLKGEAGTKVNVQVKRLGEKNLLPFTITRDKIPLYSIEATYMITPTTGYIKLVSFSRDTYSELKSSISQLKTKGMKELILDLRGNPGGYLHAATGVASEFLGKNKLMVYTQGRTQAKKEYKTDSDGGFTKGKLIILVDEGSASASEVVSGAIQDWDRGVIVGRRSFGKGLVQEPFNLQDGSGLRLTVARYYTPTGRSIQKSYKEGYDSYEAEINERFEAGEFDHPDSIKKNKSLEYNTPSGRKVYGGGGIYPDVFVPADSGIHNALLNIIYRNGFISRIAYKYAGQNRNAIKNKYKNAFELANDDAMHPQLKNLMVAVLQNSKLTYTEAQLNSVLPTVYRQAKAYIARQLFDREAYYKAINMGDPTVNAALEAMNQYDAILKGTSSLATK